MATAAIMAAAAAAAREDSRKKYVPFSSLIGLALLGKEGPFGKEQKY